MASDEPPDDPSPDPLSMLDGVGRDPKALRDVLPGGAEVDPQLLSHLVSRLNGIVVRKGMESARAVAECVIELLALGNGSDFQTVAPLHATWRALKDRGDLHVSYSFVTTCVQVYFQTRKLPPAVAEALPISHHRRLLGVKDEGTRVELAIKAAALRYTARQLEDEIQRVTAGTAQTGPGRPRIPRAVKAVRSIRTQLAELSKEDVVAEVSREDLDEVVTLLADQEAALKLVRERLERRRDAVDA